MNVMVKWNGDFIYFLILKGDQVNIMQKSQVPDKMIIKDFTII